MKIKQGLRTFVLLKISHNLFLSFGDGISIKCSLSIKNWTCSTEQVCITSIGYILHIRALRPQRQSKVAEKSGGVRALLYFLITCSASHTLLGTKVTVMSKAEMVP